ncbi:MAG: hypothetical protein HC837_14075 [Chloroflexaceae bacterium]|nr:hypothetical protein [Chloroflexaceae bacterium]
MEQTPQDYQNLPPEGVLNEMADWRETVINLITRIGFCCCYGYFYDE